MIRKKLLFLLVTVILMIPSFSVYAASGVYDDAGLSRVGYDLSDLEILL